jgi:hypothetical protein
MQQEAGRYGLLRKETVSWLLVEKNPTVLKSIQR